jgi:hypothetical protein
MTRALKAHGTAILITFSLLGLLLYLSFNHFKPLAERLDLTGNQNNQVSSSYEPPAHVANLENQAVRESSGIAASKQNSNLFWTHNDSGDGPFLYAFDRQGKHRGVWRVTGASALDWEDMAIGPGPSRGQSYIYVGDIGDNAKKRGEIIVYRVAEPSIGAESSSSTTHSPGSTGPADVIRLQYPDGKYDAESLLVHPSTGDLYIVTKVRGSAAGVYRLKAPLPTSGSATLTRVGEVSFPNGAVGFITGGDISPDGQRVALCDYRGACELVLPSGSGSAFDEIWKQPLMPVSAGARRQGEAICYRADGLALLATSERLPCPLIEITRKNR